MHAKFRKFRQTDDFEIYFLSRNLIGIIRLIGPVKSAAEEGKIARRKLHFSEFFCEDLERADYSSSQP